MALDFSLLAEGELLAVARVWERQDRFVAARRNALFAALDACAAPEWDGHPAVSSAAEWDDLAAKARSRSLAGSTGMSNTAAAVRIEAATELTGRLSETGSALEAGLLPEACARLIARRLSGVDDTTALAVQDSVLPMAFKLTYGRLDRLLQREIAQRTTDEAKTDNRTARRRRGVTPLRPDFGGMASMLVHGPAEDMAVLHAAITALGDAAHAAAKAAAREAAQPADAVEGIDAHRFDELINLACGVLQDNDLPKRHGRRPSIQLTVPAATLLGLSDAPGELDGYGPVDADTARAIAFDETAEWRRILTDPQGRLLDYGTTTYRPPQALKDLVIARDRTCTSPGCSTPARQCQIDHLVPFPRGSTSEINNDPKCGPDHNLKTAGFFTVSRDPVTGTTTWTDRHGTSYTRLPETLPLAGDCDERLAAVARALRDGRRAVTELRGVRSQRYLRGVHVTDGRAALARLQKIVLRLDDTPPPF